MFSTDPFSDPVNTLSDMLCVTCVLGCRICVDTDHLMTIMHHMWDRFYDDQIYVYASEHPVEHVRIR